MNSTRYRRGFSMLEALIVVILAAIIVGVFLPKLYSPPRVNSQRIKCVSNLKNVGLAFRIWATDNNDLYPGALMMSNTPIRSIELAWIYKSLSNELSTPKIMVCPADAKRVPAAGFTNLTPKNISYFASLTASETNVIGFLAGDRHILVNSNAATGVLPLTTNLHVAWSKDMHNELGNIAMADGSVQQMSSSRLRQAVIDQGIDTNYLVFP